MEATTGYNAVNFAFPSSSQSNTTCMFNKFPSLICPSDIPATPYTRTDYPGVNNLWGQCSYGMSRGTQENIYENWGITATGDPTGMNFQHCNAALGNGMFGAEDVVRISAVTDGTSNTAFFGETSRWTDEPARGVNWFHFTAAFGTTSATPANSIGGYFTGDLRIETGRFTLPDMNGHPDRTGQYINAVFCNCGSTACIPTDWLDPKCLGAVRKLGQFAFNSLHPGGCNFAFADGSVKFLKQTIGTQTYMALGTRAGGEVISSDAY
jgi:prepilin-type processing-associated H-X9-DG protein